MNEVEREFWETAHPWFHEHFQFWPDHEDLIWAKAIWPVFFRQGLFSDQSAEAEAWTQRNIQALAILYAGSATAFGTPDFEHPETFTHQWMAFAFGSKANLDATLDTVGRSICFSFPGNTSFEGDPAFFLPLIRSLVCGSGAYSEGPRLEAYLSRVSEGYFEMCEFREDELRRLWIGGNISSDELGCLL